MRFFGGQPKGHENVGRVQNSRFYYVGVPR